MSLVWLLRESLLCRFITSPIISWCCFRMETSFLCLQHGSLSFCMFMFPPAPNQHHMAAVQIKCAHQLIHCIRRSRLQLPGSTVRQGLILFGLKSQTSNRRSVFRCVWLFGQKRGFLKSFYFVLILKGIWTFWYIKIQTLAVVLIYIVQCLQTWVNQSVFKRWWIYFNAERWKKCGY